MTLWIGYSWKLPMTVKGRLTGLEGCTFYMQNPRELSDFKWVIADQLTTLLISSEKQKEEKATCQQDIVKDKSLLLSTVLSPHCWCLFCSQQFSSEPSASTVPMYLLHFVTPRNPHHSTQTLYARWHLKTGSNLTPTKPKTPSHMCTHKTQACPKHLASTKAISSLNSSMILWRTWQTWIFIYSTTNKLIIKVNLVCSYCFHTLCTHTVHTPNALHKIQLKGSTDPFSHFPLHYTQAFSNFSSILRKQDFFPPTTTFWIS